MTTRLGILMFGVKSDPADYLREDAPMPVSPEGPDTSVREIGPGETVSYGRIFRAGGQVASVSIGSPTASPLPQGGKLRAIVRGQYARASAGSVWTSDAGRTGIEDVGWGTRRCSSAPGDCVIYAEELAENAGTITNKLFSRLGPGGGAALPAGGLE